MTPPGQLRHYSDVAIPGSPGQHQPDEDTEFLIAALNHAWAWYDAQINRSLQVVNYFIVAGAVLATAYVSAINGKHYAIAAVLALSAMALTTITLIIAGHYTQSAHPAALVLAEVRQRIFERLEIQSVPETRAPPGNETRAPPGNTLTRLAGPLAFGLAFLLDVAALLYAVIH